MVAKPCLMMEVSDGSTSTEKKKKQFWPQFQTCGSCKTSASHKCPNLRRSIGTNWKLGDWAAARQAMGKNGAGNKSALKAVKINLRVKMYLSEPSQSR